MLVFAAVLAAVALAGPQGESIGIRLLDVPARQQDDAKARIYIIDEVRPGASISRQVGVANQTAGPLAIDLYPGAAGLDGEQFLPLEAGVTSELVSWITIEPAPVMVAAGAEAIATVTITVPDGAAPGEYYGVVWAQPPANATGGITTVNRVGVRIYLSVGARQPGRRDRDDGSDGFPWLLIAVPAAAILVGAGTTRVARRR